MPATFWSVTVYADSGAQETGNGATAREAMANLKAKLQAGKLSADDLVAQANATIQAELK